MFNRHAVSSSTRAGQAPVATLLGEGTRWQGEIQAGAEGLRIEGEVEGTVTSEGLVVVAPKGKVRGSIHAKHLTVMGRAEGVFRVEGCLEILGSGWVEGEVELSLLVVDEGGTLQGSCQRRTPPRAKDELPPPPWRSEPVPERTPPTHRGQDGGRALGVRSRF